MKTDIRYTKVETAPEELMGDELIEFAGSEWTVDSCWENTIGGWTIRAKSDKRTLTFDMESADTVLVHAPVDLLYAEPAGGAR